MVAPAGLEATPTKPRTEVLPGSNLRYVPEIDLPYADLPIYQDELAKALGFDAGELEMNRAGRLGPAETRLQMRRVVKAIGAAIVFVTAAAGFGVLLRAVGVVSVSGVELLVAIALSLVVVGLGIRFATLLSLDARAGVVESAEGVVKTAESATRIGPIGIFPGTRIWSYFWYLDSGQRFAVPGDAYAVLTPGRHRLYYLPRSRRLVAAEPVLGSRDQNS